MGDPTSEGVFKSETAEEGVDETGFPAIDP